jgi:hypothetical protein
VKLEADKDAAICKLITGQVDSNFPLVFSCFKIHQSGSLGNVRNGKLIIKMENTLAAAVSSGIS